MILYEQPGGEIEIEPIQEPDQKFLMKWLKWKWKWKCLLWK